MSAAEISKYFRRVDALEQRIAALEAAVSGGPASTADDPRFQAALADLAATMRTTIEATVDASKEELKNLVKAQSAGRRGGRASDAIVETETA